MKLLLLELHHPFIIYLHHRVQPSASTHNTRWHFLKICIRIWMNALEVFGRLDKLHGNDSKNSHAMLESLTWKTVSIFSHARYCVPVSDNIICSFELTSKRSAIFAGACVWTYLFYKRCCRILLMFREIM